MTYLPVTQAVLRQALARLGALARAEGITLELSLYGGAVFTLVYGSRDATRDVNAVAHPQAAAKRLAAQVARELGLPEDWLNDEVRLFLSAHEAKRRLAELDFGPGLNVSVPTAAYLLAMKVNACRPPLPGWHRWSSGSGWPS